MAKCASLQQIFENPLPPNPTLFESLSWRHQIKSTPPDLSGVTELFGELQFKDHSPCIDQNEPPKFQVQTSSNDENHNLESEPKPSESSFEELFGELCFKECFIEENNASSSSYNINNNSIIGFNKHVRSKSAVSDHESSLSTLANRHHSDPVNLQLCTEGLGFESFDVESNDSFDGDRDRDVITRKHSAFLEEQRECRRLAKQKSFPPPISSIGGNGKPWLYFKSYRQDGRFILKQHRIPTQLFFNAYREDGRLRLHPVCPVEQPIAEDAETEEDEEEDGNTSHESEVQAGVENNP